MTGQAFGLLGCRTQQKREQEITDPGVFLTSAQLMYQGLKWV